MFFEGGGPPSQSLTGVFAGLTEEAILLQTALYRLFEQEIPNLKVIFDIYPSGGYKQTFPAFVEFISRYLNVPAYVVLDFQELNKDWGGENAAEHKKNLFTFADEKIERGQLSRPAENWPSYDGFIFFMVQKMEAWLISQPDIIYNEFNYLKYRREAWDEKLDTHLARKHPINILNPDDVIGFLLGCFEEEKQGKWKKVKYRKIHTSTQLLPKLSLQKLMDDFDDVRFLVEKLKSLS